MKRRNGEFVGGKLRRPTKRSKISDGLNQRLNGFNHC